jgi:hypothetical protein
MDAATGCAKIAELDRGSRPAALSCSRAFLHDPAARASSAHDGHLTVATASCGKKNSGKRGNFRERQ